MLFQNIFFWAEKYTSRNHRNCTKIPRWVQENPLHKIISISDWLFPLEPNHHNIHGLIRLHLRWHLSLSHTFVMYFKVTDSYFDLVFFIIKTLKTSWRYMEVHVIRQGPKRVKRDNPESRYGHLLVRPFLLDVRHAAFRHLMMLQILKFEWTPPFSIFFPF